MNTLSLPFGDELDRGLIRESLDESLIVEAAAGTGKTRELVQRVVNLLASGRAAIDRMVIVTFTRKAAGELQLRLRGALDEARSEATDEATRDRLDEALARLEEAHIGTIHGFCAQILRERPVEAEVDPDFRELSEGEDAAVHAEAFRGWLQDQLADLPLDLERALRRDPEFGQFDDTPMERLAGASRALLQWRDHRAPWQREPLDLRAELSSLSQQVQALAEMVRAADDPDDDLARALQSVVDFDDWRQRSQQTPGAVIDLPALENQAIALGKALNRGKAGKATYGPFAPGIRRKDVEDARDDLRRALRQFRDQAEADLAAGLYNALAQVRDRYRAAKDRNGELDYLDLLLKVRDLLVNHAAGRAFLQGRFTHILVDEFQDTDALQVEILMLLSADDPEEVDWRRVRPTPGKLFLVGDPMQSIYRFRRADVVLYRQVRQQLCDHGVRLVHLSRSFRANRAIQVAVNLAFAPEMRGDDRAGQTGYVPLTGGPEAPADQPALIALPIAHLHSSTKGGLGPGRPTKKAAEAAQPEAVAAWIDWLCRHSGWTVRDPERRQRRDVRTSDICILFSRLKANDEDRSQRYADALDARRLPHVLVGSWSFKDRPEIDAMLALLTAIEWPEDDLSVYAALRGPLLALPDGLLLRYRARARLHPFAPIPHDLPPDLTPVADALALLRSWCEERNQRPISDTVHRVLEVTRAHVGLALRPAGRRALANVYRVAELARTFEAQGGLSFRGFVEALEVEAAQARGHEGPVDEPGTEGVRLMTVYAAKGLEFPVVILADVTTPSSRNPNQHIDASQGLAAIRLLGCSPRELRDNIAVERLRDQAEGVRLAYVAATRARDLLVVNTVGISMQTFYSRERDQQSWIHPLEKVLYPSPLYARSQPAPGVPRSGDASCLSLPEGQRSAQPGLHFPNPDGPPVVWWDPAVLDLDAPLPYGLRQEHYLAVDPKGVLDTEGQTAYTEWKRRSAETLDNGNIASVVPLAASEADHEPPDFEGFVDEVVLPIREGRPRGIRFGALVHYVLQDVPLDADSAAVEATAKMHGRILEAPAEEVAAAAEAVIAALQHDLLARARLADECHREWPILFATNDGETLDGSLDLAFLEQGQWVIVDFKTDQDPTARLDQYRRQMSWYVHALQQTTGTPAYGVLLRV